MPLRSIANSTAALAALVLSGPAAAHHSYAQFDPCTRVTIEGEIERLSWANPHIVMTVNAGDAGTFRVEWFDLFRLRRQGLSTEVLKEGDRVVISGARHRDPDIMVMTLLSEVRPVNGSWNWSQSRGRPANCDE